MFLVLLVWVVCCADVFVVLLLYGFGCLVFCFLFVAGVALGLCYVCFGGF